MPDEEFVPTAPASPDVKQRAKPSADQHVAELEEEVARLQAEAAAHSEKIATAESEVAEQLEDMAEQACDQAEMENEIERLQYEREQLKGSLVRAKADLAFVERKFADAERQIQDKDQLLKRPATMLAQKERKNKQLETQMAEKDAIAKGLREQLAEARAAIAKGTAGMHSEESRTQLLRHLASAQKGQASAEDRIWSLEELLEERNQSLEEAQAKADSLSAKLEEAEERGLRLAERLNEAQEQPAPEPGSSPGNAALEAALETQRAAEEALAARGAEALRHQAEVKRLEAQLRSATQVLAEFEDTTAQLRIRLSDCEAAPRQSSETKERLQVLARRCRELEAAGRKLLAELDEKDELLAERERELQFLTCTGSSPGLRRAVPVADPGGESTQHWSRDGSTRTSEVEHWSPSASLERSRSGSRSRELPRGRREPRSQRSEGGVDATTPLSGRCWGPRQPDVAASAAHGAVRAGWQTGRTWQGRWSHGGSSWHSGSYPGSWASCSDRD